MYIEKVKLEVFINCFLYFGLVFGFVFVYKVIFGDRFSEMVWRKSIVLVKRFDLKERDFLRVGKF